MSFHIDFLCVLSCKFKVWIELHRHTIY